MKSTTERLFSAAVAALRDDAVVAYPTDTLFGLGVRADSSSAVKALFQAKDRPEGSPVSVLFSSTEELEPFVVLRDQDRQAVREHLPGPYTLLLPASQHARETLAPELISPRGLLGVRIPRHEGARELARRAGPITSTSANRHGAPAGTSMPAIRKVFGDRVAVYLDLPPSPSGTPSTIIDLSGARPRVISR